MQFLHWLGTIGSPLTMPRVNGIAFRCISRAIIATIPMTSCRNAPSAPQQQIKPEPAQDRVSISDEQSCRAFVQKFYDWYWNQFADDADDPKFNSRKLHSYGDASEPVDKLGSSRQSMGKTDPEHGFRGGWAKFVVLAQSSRPSHPSEVPLHDPAFGQNLEGV
jgi:hypothetical protein